MNLTQIAKDFAEALLENDTGEVSYSNSVLKDLPDKKIDAEINVYHKRSVLNVNIQLKNFHLEFKNFELYQKATGMSIFLGHRADTLNQRGPVNQMSSHYCSQVTTVQALLDFNAATLGWKNNAVTYYAEIKNKDLAYVPRILLTLLKFAENVRSVDME